MFILNLDQIIFYYKFSLYENIRIVNIHLNIKIEGRVQGVGFRYIARNQARLLNVKGFVKNECDGTVYIEAEGTTEQISDFIKWCHEGPPTAMVTNVKIKEGEFRNYSFFDIKY